MTKWQLNFHFLYNNRAQFTLQYQSQTILHNIQQYWCISDNIQQTILRHPKHTLNIFTNIHHSRTNCITFSNRQYLTIFNNISIFGNIQYQLSEINYDISSLRYPVSDTVYQSILAISNYFETFWFYYYYYWHERVLEELLLLKM